KSIKGLRQIVESDHVTVYAVIVTTARNTGYQRQHRQRGQGDSQLAYCTASLRNISVVYRSHDNAASIFREKHHHQHHLPHKQDKKGVEGNTDQGWSFAMSPDKCDTRHHAERDDQQEYAETGSENAAIRPRSVN